ncbi:hypothetical protein Tco_1055880 [Tanacetum coccineum]|uniref:Uncharacterized protein n=1 Tax=Tanacetum coccineum TaxID=301880 RepID=A0ABQ5H0X1_9ASTR
MSLRILQSEVELPPRCCVIVRKAEVLVDYSLLSFIKSTDCGEEPNKPVSLRLNLNFPTCGDAAVISHFLSDACCVHRGDQNCGSQGSIIVHIAICVFVIDWSVWWCQSDEGACTNKSTQLISLGESTEVIEGGGGVGWWGVLGRGCCWEVGVWEVGRLEGGGWYGGCRTSTRERCNEWRECVCSVCGIWRLIVSINYTLSSVEAFYIAQCIVRSGSQIDGDSKHGELISVVTPSDIHYIPLLTRFGGVTDSYQSQGYREPVVMSSASSAVTYTSVYTDSEPGRVFWGADEEISDGGIPRVIVLGYDGLPMQPVAPPSPDYIPGPEDPQTPPVPQDEDEREPMFVQAHDPDYVPEPIYPEYIPLEDEHEFPAEEQPLPPVDSPTAESPGYVTESDPEEDPEEYEDDEIEDGPDKDDEDKEEEEEHLAPADSAIVVPADEPVSPPEGTEPGTEPVIPPPSTNITIGARITVRPQASISLPPEAEVERLLAMTTPSPSPPISLSPPSAGERLARCMAPPAHSSPPPVPSPLLPSSGCPTQIQTLRIASTQALIDAVTAALPSPPLPPLPPSLYIPPPVDRKDDIPEFEQPPRKRLCLSTLGSRYEIRESFTARPTRELAELHEHNIQDLYVLLEDAQDRDSIDSGGGGLCFLRGLGSLDRIESGDPSGASDPP